MAESGISRAKGTETMRRPESVYYLMSINSWDWGYALYIPHGAESKEAVTDSRDLVLKGALWSPFILKAKWVELRISFAPEMPFAREKNGSVDRIGLLFLQDETIKVYMTLAIDVLPSILTMLSAGRFKGVFIEGTPSLVYGEGDVYGIRFSQIAAEDETARQSSLRSSPGAATHPQAYSVAALARHWDCSDRHVRVMIKRGDIPHILLGKTIRIRGVDVEAYEKSGGGTRRQAEGSS